MVFILKGVWQSKPLHRFVQEQFPVVSKYITQHPAHMIFIECLC